MKDPDLEWVFLLFLSSLAMPGSIIKLISVKALVFFLWWQGVIISGLFFYGYIHRTVQWSDEELSAGLQVGWGKGGWGGRRA